MRNCGILMPIFSLSSPYGIGTFGKEAKDFIDFLKKAGQSYWQILPIGPTGYGDSPYQSFSAFAGNPYFIDFRLLQEDGLLEITDYNSIDFGDGEKIDYEKLFYGRKTVLKKAFSRFKNSIPRDFDGFITQNAFWLNDYARFMVIKENIATSLFEFPIPLKWRDKTALAEIDSKYADEILYHKAVQYWFSKQWFELKSYANVNGIKIIGDIPIYVSPDSSDLWANKDEFLTDENGDPKEVAGCPPDVFSEDGQLWGNPIYDWDYAERTGYSWWCKRLEHSLSLYDVVRIDHFRGFDEYYSVKFGAENAVVGEWKKGPGKKLFDKFKTEFSELPIIAEDLGFMTESVEELLEYTGFPGMAVLQFAFDDKTVDSRYLPHNIKKNSVVYVGTHDNDTAVGWLKTLPNSSYNFCNDYLRLNAGEGANWGLIKTALASSADLCIITMQDILGYGSDKRINTPATEGGNWTVRIEGSCINDWLAGIVKELTELYFR